ncbi:MAG: RNA-binding S4 domain-containing protein [Oscillospiraceae bacterium]|nr:RNA-binding S4 domain-containing protein [Oscillospiraceae bacterium]
MKVRVKRVFPGEQPVPITTEYIKLESFLKLANAVESGGMAKNFILNEEVEVNGEICTMRGKKLRPGDRVSFDGNTYRVAQKIDN